MIALFIIWLDARKGRNLHRVELGGMYWHLIDIIWIFLFGGPFRVAGSGRISDFPDRHHQSRTGRAQFHAPEVRTLASTRICIF